MVKIYFFKFRSQLLKIGSYVCECQRGFSHTSDGGYCIDDNECSKNEGACGANGRCVNTEGSYRWDFNAKNLENKVLKLRLITFYNYYW